MKKILSLILLFFLTTVCVKADDANWRIHPIFNDEVTHVIETPDYVYFTSQNIPDNTLTQPYLSLFRYDKKGDELLPLSMSNILNGNNIYDIVYNPDKGYLFVLYKDYNIDLLYNNGKVVNIPYYEQSSLSYPKNVNGMAIDPDSDRVYLATDFGYVSFNDKKEEIAESRIYGQPFSAYCRLGDIYLGATGNMLLSAPIDSPRLSLDQYDEVKSFDENVSLYPLGNNICILMEGDSKVKSVKKITKKGNDLQFEDLFEDTVYNTEYTPNGITIAGAETLYRVNPDGSVTKLARHENFRNSASTTLNMSELWNGLKRRGLSNVKITGDKWSLLKDWMLPNAPATFASSSYLNHPNHGLLMLSYGTSPSTQTLPSSAPMQLSAYSNGRWTNLAPAFTNTGRSTMLTASNGIAVDPDKKEYVYISTYRNGIARLNLSDPRDIIHMSRASDPDSNRDGFVVMPATSSFERGYSNISAPYFDKQGNLWMFIPDWDNEADPKPYFLCWTAADRRATTSVNDVKLPQLVEIDAYFPLTNYGVSLPLLKTGTGLIALASGQYSEIILLINTNGTPTDTSDDRYYSIPTFTDSDGNNVEVRHIRYMWEDPSTGYVWVCHENGVFYFVPSQIASGDNTVYRVKVPRNDGTNLADYLLDGVTVNHVAADSEGRKWFSTGGAGIVCTSSDGREIIEEFTTFNSLLPGDQVFGIGYNNNDNSLLIATENGNAEYYLPVSQDSPVKEDVRAYPNPVRPEYSGYVTITDIPQGSFVKIVDSGGNLVKELGIVSGFEILWDLSSSNYTRVRSGVYYIMISPSNETSKYSTVGKILVIS